MITHDNYVLSKGKVLFSTMGAMIKLADVLENIYKEKYVIKRGNCGLFMVWTINGKKAVYQEVCQISEVMIKHLAYKRNILQRYLDFSGKVREYEKRSNNRGTCG